VNCRRKIIIVKTVKGRRGKKQTITEKRKCGKPAFIFLYCKDHWLKVVRSGWFWLGVVVFFIVLPTIYWAYREHYKSPMAKAKEDATFIVPMLAPFGFQNNVVIYQSDSSYFEGSNYSAGTLYDYAFGMSCTYNDSDGKIKSEELIPLRIKVLNGFFKLSIKLKDLDGNDLAELTDNQLTVVRKHYGSVDSSPDHVEITDEKGYVAFRLWIDSKQHVQMRGYGVGIHCAIVYENDYAAMMPDNPKKPEIRQKLEEAAGENKPMFIKHL